MNFGVRVDEVRKKFTCLEKVVIALWLYVVDGFPVSHLCLPTQSVHDNFEYIDNQVISKIDAHFGCFKLSECALEFLTS